MRKRPVKKKNDHLKHVTYKIQHDVRLTKEEGLKLLEIKNPDELLEIKELADHVRKKKTGETVYFASTLFLYPTNLCELSCPFCSFYAKPGWKKAWFSTPLDIEKKIRSFPSDTFNEVHIVGGLWRECDLNYYQELFTRIKGIDEKIHIKALTAVEYDFLAKLHGISIENVLEKMISWGLGSLPGGGAEILDEEIRPKLAPGKITSDEFLNIHKIAHKIGLRSNISMLFNHVETNEHIMNHLQMIRDCQDETKGFKTFIPLKFGEEDNALGRQKKRLNKKNVPLIFGVARLFLDNIKHIKALWNYLGVYEALEILDWGANDLSSTNHEEKVIDMAGGYKINMDREMMGKLILHKKRIPQYAHSGELPC